MLSRKLRAEIARADLDPRHVVFGGEPKLEDPTLRGQLGGRYEAYRRLLDEPQISSKFDQRVQAAIGKERVLEALSEEEQDIHAQRLCEWWLEFGNFDEVCRSLFQAIIMGRSHAEMIWDTLPTPKKLVAAGFPHEEIQVPVEIRPKAQEFFSFKLPERKLRKNAPTDSRLPGNPPRVSLPPQIYKGYELRVSQDNLGRDKITAPVFKFITHSFGSLTDNPNGHGLGGKLYWLSVLKKDFIKYWAIHADKFASPGMWGEYPEDEDPDLLEEFFEEYQGGKSWAALPAGYRIHLLEQMNSGKLTTYLDFLNWCDRQMSGIITGQTFGPEVSQGLGGQPAKVDDEIRNEWVKADCDLLAPNLRRMLFYPITVLNLQGAETPFFYWDTSNQEDLNTRSERDERLFNQGYRLKPEAVARIYGDDYTPISSAPETAPSPEVTPGGDMPLPGQPVDQPTGARPEQESNVLVRLGDQPSRADSDDFNGDDCGEIDSQEDSTGGSMAEESGLEIVTPVSAAQFWESFIIGKDDGSGHSDSLLADHADARIPLYALSAVEALTDIYDDAATRVSRLKSFSRATLRKVATKLKSKTEEFGDLVAGALSLSELLEREEVYLRYQPDLASLTWDEFNRAKALRLGDAVDLIRDIPDTRASFEVLVQANSHAGSLARLLLFSLLEYARENGPQLRAAPRQKDRLQIMKDGGWVSKFGEITSYKARLGLETPFIRSSGAGRMASLEEISGKYPFWLWRQNTVAPERRRPEHRGLHGLCLSALDPFWQLYFPPQQINCICDVIPVRQIPAGSMTEPPQEVVSLDGVPILAVEVDLEDAGRRLIPISSPGFIGSLNSKQGRLAPIDALKKRLDRWV